MGIFAIGGSILGGVALSAILGFSFSSNTAKVRQESINDFYQESRSSCLNFISQTNRGITIYVGPGATLRKANFSQKATQQASCMLNTSIESFSETELEIIQEQITRQSGSTGAVSFVGGVFDNIGLSFGTQRAVADAIMRNTITQMISSECNASIRMLNQNITVYLAEGATAEDVDFTQSASQEVNCSILNNSMIEAYSKSLVDQSQETKQQGSGTQLLMILGIIGGVVAVASLAFGLGGRNKGSNETSEEEEEEETGEVVQPVLL